MYAVYILYNSTINKFYIGYSSKLVSRIYDHNKPLHLSKFTRKQPGKWELVYSEDFPSKEGALEREKEIKKMKSRKYIEGLIEQSRL